MNRTKRIETFSSSSSSSSHASDPFYEADFEESDNEDTSMNKKRARLLAYSLDLKSSLVPRRRALWKDTPTGSHPPLLNTCARASAWGDLDPEIWEAFGGDDENEEVDQELKIGKPNLKHLWWKIKSYLIDYSKLRANLATRYLRLSLRPMLFNLREEWNETPKTQWFVFQETTQNKISPEDRLISSLPVERVNCLDFDFIGDRSFALMNYRVQYGTDPMRVIHLKRSPSGEMVIKCEVWNAVEDSTELGRRHKENDPFLVNRKSIKWQLLQDAEEAEENAEEAEENAEEAEENAEEAEEEAEEAEESEWSEIDRTAIMCAIGDELTAQIDPSRPFCTYIVECKESKAPVIVDLTHL
jgi:hypothetical protein